MTFQKKFVIEKYIERQPDVMRSMRAILVDWMVEVQVRHSTGLCSLDERDLTLSLRCETINSTGNRKSKSIYKEENNKKKNRF